MTMLVTAPVDTPPIPEAPGRLEDGKGTTVDGHGGERDCTGRLSTGVLTHAVSPHSGRVFSSLYTIGDDEVGEKMKFHYDAAGSVCRCAVHQFRSRVQNERERRWRKDGCWRERVLTQYVATHRCCGESRFSTPEYRAHDCVCIGRSVGTSATKVKG